MLTIVIPTYKEHDNIPELAERIKGCLRNKIANYCVLIVDDSPDDRTSEAAWKAGFQVIRRRGETGLSSAVYIGIKNATADKIIVMDADLQHPPEILSQMLSALETHDFVIASRYVQGGGVKNWSFSRRIISKVANLLGAPLVKFKYKDLQSGFFALRKDKLPALKKNELQGFKIMLELLVQGRWNNPIEIPFTFETRKRGESKLSKKQIFAYLKQLARLYVKKYPILSFMLVGGIGYIANMAVYYPLTLLIQNKTTLFGQEYYLPPFFISSYIALTLNYYLNKHWTFGEQKEESFGYGRYIGMGAFTIVMDAILLFLLVKFLDLNPMVAIAIAVAVMFLVRYFIVKRLIWAKSKV